MNELGTSCEWDRFELFGILSDLETSSKWDGALLYINLSLCPTKKSLDKFIHKREQAGNEF